MPTSAGEPEGLGRGGRVEHEERSQVRVLPDRLCRLPDLQQGLPGLLSVGAAGQVHRRRQGAGRARRQAGDRLRCLTRLVMPQI